MLVALVSMYGRSFWGGGELLCSYFLEWGVLAGGAVARSGCGRFCLGTSICCWVRGRGRCVVCWCESGVVCDKKLLRGRVILAGGSSLLLCCFLWCMAWSVAGYDLGVGGIRTLMVVLPCWWCRCILAWGVGGGAFRS